MPLSVAIITRNAAGQLERCLASVAFADEVVVVDSGSTDGTVELAARHGARVVRKEWLGFGAQKQYAVDAASHVWVLCIDADECLSPELREAIVAELKAPRGFVYAVARRNRFMGRWLRHGEGYPDWNVRLFDRRRARWSDDAVHERVICDGPVATLAGDLEHESAESLDAYVAKQNRYTTLQAQALHERGRPASVARLLLSPLVRFVRFYFLKLGFLDGAAGLVHILIGCGASFLKQAKLLGLERAGRAPARP